MKARRFAIAVACLPDPLALALVHRPRPIPDGPHPIPGGWRLSNRPKRHDNPPSADGSFPGSDLSNHSKTLDNLPLSASFAPLQR